MYSAFELGIPEQPMLKDRQKAAEYQRLYSTLHSIANELFPKDGISSADYNSLGTTKVDYHRYSTVFVTAGANISARRALGLYNDGGVLKACHSNFTSKRWPIGISMASVAAGELVPFCFFGIVGGFSGLTPFESYGTRGDDGVLAAHNSTSLTAGTHIIVGYAVSPTQLFWGGTTNAYMDKLLT